MDASHTTLVFATLAFVGGHFVLSSAPVRGPLAGLLRVGPFRAVYSILMAAALVWMIEDYRFATYVRLWDAGVVGPVLLYACMLLASILMVCSLTTRNPTLAGMGTIADPVEAARGIYAVTRHPMMWAIALWAAAHLIERGDLAGLVFFGGFLVLAIGGTVHIDARRRAHARAEGDDAWPRFEAATSRIPFLAILRGRAELSLSAIGWGRIAGGVVLFVALFLLHGPLVGIYLAPIGF